MSKENYSGNLYKIYNMKLTIEQFNEKYGVDAFQLAIDLGFDKDELLENN